MERVLGAMTHSQEAARAAATRIDRIVRNLRRFVHLDSAEWMLADVHEGIESALAVLAGGSLPSRITVERRYANLPRIYCSPGGLNQALAALLTNAVEAIDGEGTITRGG